VRRRDARRAELAALGLAGPRTPPRRHLTPVLYLLALTLLFAALARPQATVAEPRREGTVVLAFDVSASMAATDLNPTRMEAAKAAARRFVERQPTTVKVGVVAFGESGLVTQQPTADKSRVVAAIDRLTPAGGTALGRGIQTSLAVIVGKPVTLPSDAAVGPGSGAGSGSVEEQGADLGYHGSAAVILLSDGENTTEPDPLGVAELASTAGVKVYPIGLGSPQGTVLEIDGFQVATALDEAMLRRIASTTDGEYFAAADEASLARVYDSIDPLWTVQAKKTEVTALAGVVAALLLLVGASLSLTRAGRVI
jgi:Ca-activated chloride channel family protein